MESRTQRNSRGRRIVRSHVWLFEELDCPQLPTGVMTSKVPASDQQPWQGRLIDHPYVTTEKTCKTRSDWRRSESDR